MLSPVPSSSPASSSPWAGVLWSFVLGGLVLLSVCWAIQARAADANSVYGGHDPADFLLESVAEDDDEAEPYLVALDDEDMAVCGKPTRLQLPVADGVLSEIADTEAHFRAGMWLVLPQAVPVQGPQPELPQIEPQPLLRPPARLA